VVELNFTLVLFAASFLLFLGLMYFCFFRPLGLLINRREADIANNRKKAESIMGNLNARIKEYEDNSVLKVAREEVAALIDSVKKEAKQVKEKHVQASAKELKQRIDETIASIERDKESITLSLKGSIGEVGKLMIAAIFKTSREELKI
jgi:F0F1-type ATP synthase membrane subunit b/b'